MIEMNTEEVNHPYLLPSNFYLSVVTTFNNVSFHIVHQAHKYIQICIFIIILFEVLLRRKNSINFIFQHQFFVFYFKIYYGYYPGQVIQILVILNGCIRFYNRCINFSTHSPTHRPSDCFNAFFPPMRNNAFVCVCFYCSKKKIPGELLLFEFKF